MHLCRLESFPFPLKETEHLLLFSLDLLTDALVGVAGCLARNDCKKKHIKQIKYISKNTEE